MNIHDLAMSTSYPYRWTIKVTIFLLLLLFLDCFAIFPSLELSRAVSQAFYFRWVSGIMLLYLSICWFVRAKSFIRLNVIDLSVFAYIAYTIFCVLTNPLLPWYSEHMLTNFLLLTTYFFFKSFLHYCSFLVSALVILQVIALGEVLLGGLQWAGYLPSWNDAFQVTGSFFNPAPYAGFLISILPIACAAMLSPTSLLGNSKEKIRLYGLQ